ncbi:hypothetical protein OROMI_032199 [Orobanche minor]
MAGSSSTLIVTKSPAKDLAYTNFAYCAPGDLQNFIIPESNNAYAFIGDVCYLYPEFELYCLVGCGLEACALILTEIIQPLRFIPPEDFNLALLTLELEIAKNEAREEQGNLKAFKAINHHD